MDELQPSAGLGGESSLSRSKKLGFSSFLWQCSTLLSTGASIVLTLVVARLRGPEWYGDLATYLFIANLGAIIGALGIPSTLSKYVSELEGSSSRRIALVFSRRQVKTVVKTGFVAAAGVLLMMILLFLGKGYSDFESLVVLSVSVPVTILMSSATQMSIGLQDFRSVLHATLVSKTFLIVVGLTVVMLGCPLYVYLCVLTTSTAIAAVMQLRSSGMLRSEETLGQIPSDVIPRARVYGRTLWINGILDLAVWQQSGVFFLWVLVGSGSSGQFSVAYTITYTFISLLSGSIVVSLFPELSRLYGAGGARRSLATFRVGFKANGMLVAPIATMLAVGGPHLVLLVFGVEYSVVSEIVVWLTISSGFVALGAPAVSLGYALEKHIVWMKISILDSILAVVLFMVLVPMMGVQGAVIVQSGVQILGVCIALYVVAVPMKVQIPWIHNCAVVGIAVVSYLPVFLLLDMVSLGVATLVAWAVIGSIVYIVCVTALAILDRDTSLILRTVGAMIGQVRHRR